jgi:type IV secretion/conjugal transfer VirB4 family ATPase
MSDTHEYEYGVCDFIQATALVEDGVVALKDGGLLAGWGYTGADYTPETAGIIRDRMASVLDFGKGWVVETNAIRLPSTTYPAWGEFPNDVARLIEVERSRNYTVKGRYYETHYYLTLTYFPPSKASETAKGWLYESPEGTGLAEQALAHFRNKIGEFETLAGGFLEMARLKGDGEVDNLLRYIQLCIIGEDRPFLIPDSPVDLDFLLGGVDLLGGTKPELGGRLLRVLAVDPLPQAIYPAMLHALEELAMPFRLHGRALLLDRHEAAKLHELNQARHTAKFLPFWSHVMKIQGAIVNERAALLAADASTAKSLTEDRGESWGMYSARVVLIRDTAEEMQAAMDAVQSCAEAAHVKVRVETFNVNDAYFGSLPGHAFCDVRQVPIRAYNIAGMSPLHSIFTGHPYCPSPKMPPKSSPLLVATGEGMSVVRHNVHVQDVGHVKVLGPTGSGKTTLFGLYAVSVLRYPGAQVVMFDRNGTQAVLCKALGGKHYNFGADVSLQLCPLGVLDSPSDLAWACNFIEILCKMNGLVVTAAHTECIGKAMERFARSKHRSLSHFSGQVGDLEVQEALQLYTVGNAISARLLDGEVESIADSHFTVFEMAELMGMNEKVCKAAQLHLFRRVERKLNPSRLTAIFLDEARRMIGDDLFARTIENWLKEIRNLNGFVVLALQELTDARSTKLETVLAEQCKTKVFLPNPAARGVETRRAYTNVGLSGDQIDQICHGRQKCDYFVSTPDSFSRIRLDLEGVALSFIASGQSDRALVDRLAVDNPEGWQSDFLRARGLHSWADYLDHMRRGGV